MKTFQQKLGTLPVRWRWALHNIVGHPVSEFLWQFGLLTASDWIHDVTLPDPVGEESRG